MELDKKEIIYRLVTGVFKHYNDRRRYGNMRRKLDKKGFSEISLYSFVAMHLEENAISPDNYIKDMVDLLEGCSQNAFYPKTSSIHHYLHGDYYNLRHGDLTKGEAKSPEQRGQFICNACGQIKDSKERSKRKSYPNSCDKCANELMREVGRKCYQRKKEQENVKAAVPVPKPEDIETEVEETPAVDTPAVETAPVTPRQIPEPMFEPAEEVRVVKPARSRQVNGELVNDHSHLPEVVLGSKIASIEDITGDPDSTIIQLSCATANLHKVLHALSSVLGR